MELWDKTAGQTRGIKPWDETVGTVGWKNCGWNSGMELWDGTVEMERGMLDGPV